MNIQNRVIEIEQQIQKLSSNFEGYQIIPTQKRQEQIESFLANSVAALDPDHRKRVLAEFQGFGPLQSLMEDPEVTEILVNGPDKILFEKKGVLQKLEDMFSTDLSYRNFVHRVLEKSHLVLTSEAPVAHGHYQNFRLHVVGPELTKSHVHFSFRRHPDSPWTFRKLIESGWGNERQIQTLKDLLNSKTSFLIVGATGSGKTSVINACLQEMANNERCAVLEDTLELKLPNDASYRLLTREDNNGILKTIDQSELVRNSLRMRPDRIVMGEIRGSEAKDFLMALSTGHSGSFGSLHASSAAQALIRLEMLIQLGAPHWSLMAVRRLIQLSLQAIVVVKRDKEGRRYLDGIYRLASLEENGILLEKIEGCF